MKKMRRVLAFLIAAVMAASNVPIDVQAAQNGRSHQTNLVRGLTPTVAWVNDETQMTEDETDSNTLGRATDGTIDINNYLRYGEASNKKASYVQFDLGTECTISEIKMWRYWDGNRNYAPTAIVISNSADSWTAENVVYSSDSENVFGFGMETVTDATGYTETADGKTISAKDSDDNARIARYVRIYSYGSNVNSGNHLVEFEVYGVINDGVTQNQPFTSGAAGSEKLRIPAMVTLDSGSIVAAADARWNTYQDGGGLDTIVSYSDDNGATWNYSLQNYLDDNGNVHNKASTAFIDPILTTDGINVYMIVDLFPAGYALNTNSANAVPPVDAENGFDANGNLRLSNDNRVSYGYYLKDGKIYSSANEVQAGYTVDDYFNITGTDGTTTNLFCADSPFKVYPTNYLYLTKSTDGGKTFGAPTLINEKKEGEQTYLVGPGRGLVTSDNRIIIPCYMHDGETERMSFIYSDDLGVTWTRSTDATNIRSSEAQVVELDDCTLRFFFRNSEKQVCYVDATENATDGYTWGEVVYTGVYSCSNTQMSAIKYSKRIDGREAIIISYPASSSAEGNNEYDRVNGCISIGLVQDDGSMVWKYTYEVNNDTFWYSCLSELKDQSIGILYENGANGAAIQYEKYGIDVLAEGANVSDIWATNSDGTIAEKVSIKANESITLNINGISSGEEVTVTSADDTILTAVVNENRITLTGLSGGNTGIANTTVTVSTPTGGTIVLEAEVVEETAENLVEITIPSGSSIGLPGSVYDTPTYDSNIVEVQTSGFSTPVLAEIEALEVGNSTTVLLVLTGDTNKYTMSSKTVDNSSPSALKIDQLVATTDLSQYYWKITRVDNGYTIQTVSDTPAYINGNGESITLTTEEESATVFSFNTDNSGYTVSYITDGYKKYFNKHGGGFNKIAGYSSADGAIFELWQAETVVTGIDAGTTTMRVGNTLYKITVDSGEEDVLLYVGEDILCRGRVKSNSDSSVVSTEEIADNQVKITATKFGTTDVVIGGMTYHITVKEAFGTYVQTLYLTVGETKSVANDSTDTNIEVGSYDQTVADVALSTDKTTITVTGSAEGYTIVDVGPTRCYIYVTNETKESVVSEEEVVIAVGQTKTFESTENGPDPVTTDENYDVCLENVSITGVHQDLLAIRGTAVTATKEIEAYYVGTPVDLNDCLYTFTSNGTDNQYYITGKTTDGGTVYLNHAKATAPYANTTLQYAIEITNDGNGLFHLKDSSNGTKYLTFSRDGKNQLSIVDAIDGNCKFDLYCRATAEELSNNADNELPGYVKVSSVENGKQYLIVASYTKGDKTYYYAVYPTLETGEHAQTVLIIPEQIVGNKYSVVSFTGKAAGKTTLQVDNKTYYITVKEKSETPDYDTTPVISLTRVSAGSPLTKLAMSADRTFKVAIGNGYSADNVVWEIQNEDGTKANWATITEAGVISAANPEEHKEAHTGYIVATIDGQTCKVPLVLSPAPDLSEGETSRQYDIYIEDVYHTNVYYGWIYGKDSETLDANGNKIYTYSNTELTEVIGGEVIYVSVSKECYTAIDFFGKPEAGYALTEMGATGSQGHYKRLEGDSPDKTEFITENGVAGHTQYHKIGAEVTSALVQLAMTKGCDGAQGFTREANLPGLETILSYRSEKLPTVEKNIVGILGKDGLASSYREYTPGMTAQVGEYIYYEINVETYDSQTDITYSDVVLKDTLDGATFYEKDSNAATQTPTSGTSNTITITDEIETDGKVGQVHTYYVVYKIKDTDLQLAQLTNTVQLSYKYKSEYSSGNYDGSDESKADVVITTILLDNIVIDFGLPVKNVCTTNGRYFESTTDPIITTYGRVTVESKETSGVSENGLEEEVTPNSVAKKYENIVTYTPTKMLCGVDEVTLKLNNDDGTSSYYTFYVYPANSVYYEEGFAEYSAGWDNTGSAGTEEQTLQQLKAEDTGHYGFDSKYAGETTGPSNGTEAMSTFAGKTTDFTFGGTGLDIYANCQGGDTPTGTVTVMIKNTDTQKIEKLMIVNTKVAGSTDGVTNAQNSIGTAFGLPIVSAKDLTSGNHTVRIGHTRTRAEAEAGKDNPVRIDGFRVYNTLTDQTAYSVHNETAPQYIEMRNVVLNALGIADLYDTDNTDGESIYAEDIANGLKQVLDKTETGAGVVIVDSTLKADGYTTGNAQDLLDNGPKGEIFLYNGQSLVMGLNDGLKNVQIGLKAINSEVTLKISKKVQNEATTTVLSPSSVSSSTDMYYVLGDIDSATTITITNTTGGILSITDLKYFVGTDTAQVFYGLTEVDFMPLLLNAGYKLEAAEESTKHENKPGTQTNSNIVSSETSIEDEEPQEVYMYIPNDNTSSTVEETGKSSVKSSEEKVFSNTIEVAELEETETLENIVEEPEVSKEQSDSDINMEKEQSNARTVIGIGGTIVAFFVLMLIILGVKKRQKD